MGLESPYQTRFIKKLERLFPGCIVLKNDANYRPGVPDLILLAGINWATFEMKRKEPTSSIDFEPNQEWYIDTMNEMSFSACVYPENEEDVLDALKSAFRAR